MGLTRSVMVVVRTRHANSIPEEEEEEEEESGSSVSDVLLKVLNVIVAAKHELERWKSVGFTSVLRRLSMLSLKQIRQKLWILCPTLDPPLRTRR